MDVTCPYADACLHRWAHDIWSLSRLKFNITRNSICSLRPHSWVLHEHSHLHDGQNESRRLPVTFIYAFIHTRDKIWQETSCERVRESLCERTRAIRNIVFLRFSFSSDYVLAYCPRPASKWILKTRTYDWFGYYVPILRQGVDSFLSFHLHRAK
jgi:hypothetical protein